MTVAVQIDHVAGMIASAASMTEATFLETGRGLEVSATRLRELTEVFERLGNQLTGAEIEQATRGLQQVAAQVTKVAGSRTGERDLLGQLNALAASVDDSVARMRAELRTIGVLTVNARIVAAGLGAAGGDFLGYVAEIAPSLALTQSNLEQFDRELAAVDQHLRTALASEAAFDRGHGRAVESLPPRLIGGIDVIGARRHRAAEAASEVGQHATQVGGRIGSAILALQVGDATRQRIEHSQAAAQLFLELLRDGDLDEPAWAALDETERRQLVASGCRLEAALLADAAEEYERDVASVASALRELASDAAEIVRLGTDTFAGSDGGSPFLRELEADIDQVGRIFDGFRAARAVADEVMSSVVGIANRLSRHIGTVRALEADIRIMGFNTTFKCSRLGDRGRPLAIISQELRACSTRTGVAAAAVTEEIGRIAATARELTADERNARGSEIAGVTATMAGSTALLRSAGESLAAALASLTVDGAEVSGMIETAVARMSAQGEIGGTLKAASAHLQKLAAEVPADRDITGAEQALYARLARRYTMARERDVHARVTGAAPTAAAETAGSIDDMLF